MRAHPLYTPPPNSEPRQGDHSRLPIAVLFHPLRAHPLRTAPPNISLLPNLHSLHILLIPTVSTALAAGIAHLQSKTGCCIDCTTPAACLGGKEGCHATRPFQLNQMSMSERNEAMQAMKKCVVFIPLPRKRPCFPNMKNSFTEFVFSANKENHCTLQWSCMTTMSWCTTRTAMC
jgi:hypothetical protein